MPAGALQLQQQAASRCASASQSRGRGRRGHAGRRGQIRCTHRAPRRSRAPACAAAGAWPRLTARPPPRAPSPGCGYWCGEGGGWGWGLEGGRASMVVMVVVVVFVCVVSSQARIQQPCSYQRSAALSVRTSPPPLRRSSLPRRPRSH